MVGAPETARPRDTAITTSSSDAPGARRMSTRPKHNLPATAKALFREWFSANYDHPFPDGSVKAELAARTGERLLTSCAVRSLWSLADACRAEFNLSLQV